MATTKKKWSVKRMMNSKAWKWRIIKSSGAGMGGWKRLNFKLSCFSDLLFKIVSFFEAIVLVSSLCFFYCFCGCHF